MTCSLRTPTDRLKENYSIDAGAAMNYVQAFPFPKMQCLSLFRSIYQCTCAIVVYAMSNLCHVLPGPLCDVAMPVFPLSRDLSTLPCRMPLANVPVRLLACSQHLSFQPTIFNLVLSFSNASFDS